MSNTKTLHTVRNKYGLTIRLDEPQLTHDSWNPTFTSEVRVQGDDVTVYDVTNKPPEFDALLQLDTQNIPFISEFVFIRAKGTVTITTHTTVPQSGIGIFILADNATITIHKTSTDSCDASLDVLVIQGTATVHALQSVSKNTVSFQNRVLSGTLTFNEKNIGGRIVTATYSAQLNTENDCINQSIVYSASHNQQFNIHTQAIHTAPHTTSYTVTRGVVQDKALALTRGLVRIESTAEHANGYEKLDSLIVSPTAQAFAIPNLEIHNHNVKCSHGATVGQINPEQIYYLMSRGLTHKQATQSIVQAYLGETQTPGEEE